MKRRLASALVVLALFGCGGSTVAPVVSGSAPTRSPAASSPSPAASQASVPSGDPSPTPDPTPAPVLVPLVPVTGFWSDERSISRADLAVALAGTGKPPRDVYVADGQLEPLAAALGVVPGPNVRQIPPANIPAKIANAENALAILRAADVTPGVRALAVDGVGLFGEERARRLSAWPLLIPEVPGSGPSAFDPASLWTLAAGGDVMLDREVYRLAVLKGRGADYPWDGGTAAITARVCCGWPGLEIVRGQRTGQGGAVRALLGGADLTIVNLEGPAPDDFSYHPHGFVFTMDPSLLAGLDGAGIDAVSLANNHITNAGAAGVIETIHHMDGVDISTFGAGPNEAAARQPAWLVAGGMSVALLGYNAVGADENATATRAGAAPLRPAAMRADIRDARRAGADLVIVVPHWGREYTDAVSAQQRSVARDLVSAGADLVLGSHSHWAAPLELIDDRLVVYSLGDLVFDLQHDERTQQGLIVELTFAGRRLAQVELHPTLILEASQPNLLEPANGGRALLRAIERASERLAP